MSDKVLNFNQKQTIPMIPSILQLTGSILLAIMTSVRKTNQIQMYSTNFLVNITGRVSPRLFEVLKETYLFRVGLAFICLGYLLQIAEVDMQCLETNRYKILFATIVAAILSFLGYFSACFYAKYKFSKIMPFDPNIGPHPEGSIYLEDNSKII